MFEHVPRAHNKYAGVLAILFFKIDVPEEMVNVQIMKRTLRVIVIDLFSNSWLMCRIDVVPLSKI